MPILKIGTLQKCGQHAHIASTATQTRRASEMICHAISHNSSTLNKHSTAAIKQAVFHTITCDNRNNNPLTRSWKMNSHESDLRLFSTVICLLHSHVSSVRNSCILMNCVSREPNLGASNLLTCNVSHWLAHLLHFIMCIDLYHMILRSWKHSILFNTNQFHSALGYHDWLLDHFYRHEK